MSETQFIGVDVAKDKFNVALGEELDNVFANNKAGLKAFLAWIKEHTTHPWVCMEATGCYSEEIAEYLISQGIRATIANPMQIKHFCRAKLLRNKNDVVDARAIAHYAKVMPLHVHTVRPQAQKELNSLNKLLDMLKKQLIQLQNQYASAQGKRAKKRLEKLINDLISKIEEIEKEVGDVVGEDESLQEKFNLLTSIPGVGRVTAHQVLGIVTDINSFKNAKEFAAFIGVSPKQNESGKFKGVSRISKIGNRRLRKALYMASLSAKRHNKNLKEFVSRLESKGKAPKAVSCAVMRKLAHLIFSLLKSGQPFVENYGTPVPGSSVSLDKNL